MNESRVADSFIHPPTQERPNVFGRNPGKIVRFPFDTFIFIVHIASDSMFFFI